MTPLEQTSEQQRDETQDMWIWEDGGDCLGVCEYSERMTDDGDEIGSPEAERYVPFSHLEAFAAVAKAAGEFVDATDDYDSKQHEPQAVWKKADARMREAERRLKAAVLDARKVTSP